MLPWQSFLHDEYASVVERTIVSTCAAHLRSNNMNSSVTPDWDELRRAATEAASHARASYSTLHVGAAGLLENGSVVLGCNVEAASFGLTLCAECGLVSAAQMADGGRLTAVSVVNGNGDFLTPCGRCRQLLYEAGGPDLLLDTDEGPTIIAELLPGAFTKDDLPE
jgi:cytidine deaminase